MARSSSLFSVITSTLTSDLSDHRVLDSLLASGDSAEMEERVGDTGNPGLSSSPSVSLGRYHDKLVQLSTLREELWRHSPLLNPQLIRYAPPLNSRQVLFNC